MKNIFKKNSIIITALAIMIVIAGYLSFTNKDTKEKAGTVADQASVETEAKGEFTKVDGLDVATNTTGTDTTGTGTTGTDTTGTGTTGTTAKVTGAADISGAATDTGVTTDTNTKNTNDELGKDDISDEDILANAKDVADNGELNLKEGTPGEAVLANTADASYFTDAKVKREQARAKSRENLMDIIQSATVKDKDKQAAIDSMVELNNTIDKEAAAEILLEGKGFDGAVVFIVDGKAKVTVNAATLSKQQRAVIEDVVKDETGITVDKMEIVPVVVEE